MRILPVIFEFATFLLLGFGLYLAYQNRNSSIMREKAVPALVIAAVAAFFTVWFSLKNESVKTHFTPSVFININDKNPLDSHENRHLLYGGDQFDGKLQSYIRNTLSTKNDLTTDGNNVSEQAVEFCMDMMIIEVVSRIPRKNIRDRTRIEYDNYELLCTASPISLMNGIVLQRIDVNAGYEKTNRRFSIVCEVLHLPGQRLFEEPRPGCL